jgi:hypothetical protein
MAASSASLTINLLDSSDDDEYSIPPSSGLAFLRDEPEFNSKPSHPPPARVSTSTHKKARVNDNNNININNTNYEYHVDTPQQPPQPQPKTIETVWLVYHQKEPYYHSAWSYDSHLRYGPSSIDKICVGVYDSKMAADAAALLYWEKQVRKPQSDQEDYTSSGSLGGYFYNGMDSGSVNTLSQRVFTEQQSLNPAWPTKTNHDEIILQRRGRM